MLISFLLLKYASVALARVGGDGSLAWRQSRWAIMDVGSQPDQHVRSPSRLESN